MQLIHKVEQLIQQEKLIAPGERLVAAVSGGPDSMALIHLLLQLAKTWNWKLMIGHVNHQFRKEESVLEAEFVQGWAEQAGIPCQIAVIDVPAYIRETGDNAQNAAREKRLQFLAHVAGQFKARKIVLGHHADDQAETILMRLIRGTGPSGLAGMAYSQSWNGLQLVRPLLDVHKEELIGYCKEHKLEYQLDSSNAERKYTRNRIRLDAIPYLQSYNPHFVENLNRLAGMMRAEEDYLNSESEEAFKQLVQSDTEGEMSFSAKAFLTLHVALQRRLIKLILNYLDCCADSVDFAAIESMRLAIGRNAPSNLTLDIHRNLSFFKEYDRISLVVGYKPAALFEYSLDFTMNGFEIANTGKYVKYMILDTLPELHNELAGRAAVFDYDRLRLPLVIRNRRNGDRMQVFGLNGSKKVKDIFIDAKLPPRKRDHMPLLVDSENSVLWIPGVKRSAHASVTDSTTRFLYIVISEEQSEMV
ncbi:tRNA lysidine(34) synthetase TilS [Paenibacillus senegalensis]|uniref:tRNA lysidine(34) synthetase TilS n=1 Tax=Paenibacillus senegalensis TaxID=1465766 RepID=UPI000289B78A|nr:tRNA lysidine(34) synthetase TilS [Paenibacillus senegalensis]